MESVFSQVYESGVFVLGEHLREFEKRYAFFNQTAFCVGVSSGLDALTLSLRAIGIGFGDEVIVPANTYVATALAVSHVGAKPSFVEPREDSYNIDVSRVQDAITPRTKAIIPVHLYGQACEMPLVMSIARRNNLTVIEDNAQSHGSGYGEKRTGGWGDINATSFYPGKNLGGLGDGGAVTTDSNHLANNVRLLRNYGSDRKYYNEVLGYNNRLDELQAAFLNLKLENLDHWTMERKQIARFYLEKLAGVGDLVLPWKHPEADHVFHLFVIRTSKRDALKKYLRQNGIDTLIHYPIPAHLQKAYNHLGHKKGDFPIAEQLASTSLSLPIYPGLSLTEVQFVTDQIKAFYNA